MKVQIISVDIDADIEKADKSGTYKGVLISFKNIEKNTLQQKGIHNNVISKNHELLTKLKSLNKGDMADFKFEANGKFQNLVDITLAEKVVYTETPTAAAPVKFNPAHDRAKQLSICRQSAVAAVVRLLVAQHEISTVDDELIDFVIEKAEKLVKYTHGD